MDMPILPPIRKKNSNSDEKFDSKVTVHDNIFNRYFGTNIPPDYFKIILIAFLLAASVVMYRYPPAPTLRRVNNTEVSYEQVRSKDTVENPHGFHAFYQVHERVKYKNPTTSPCEGIEPSKTILLAILSRASNAHIREAIRQTWGGTRVYNEIEIRLTFIVGVDDGMIKQIEIEQALYHDVVQVNLPENYPVVSYKELAALCWSKYFCPDIQYVFKADEDIHLNTPLLTSLIAEFLKNETLPNVPVMYGWFRHKSRVDRVGRYLITEEEYPGFYYPPYTFGIGYLITRAARENLCVSARLPHPVTRVGDAYITGILRDHANVHPVRFGDVHYIYSYTLNGRLCREYFRYDPKLLVCMSSVHSGSNDAADEYVNVWNAVYKDVEDGGEGDAAGGGNEREEDD